MKYIRKPFLPLLLIILTASIGFCVHSALAISPSPSPSTLPNSIDASTSSDAVQRNIKDRLQKMQQGGSDAQVKGIATQLQNTFGIVGTLEKSVGSTLQVQTVKGNIRVIELDPNAVLLKNGKTIKRADLELNTPVIIMGFIGSDSTYTGKRLIIGDQTLFPDKRETILGKITTLTARMLGLLTRADNAMIVNGYKISFKTSYFDALNNQIKRTDLSINDNVVAVLDTDPTATTSAVRVYSLSTKPKSSPISLP